MSYILAMYIRFIIHFIIHILIYLYIIGDNSYHISAFLSRNLGWYHDNSAVMYGCQLRALLRNVTGESVYLRPVGYAV